MNKPKILLWDIETSLSIVATFSLFDEVTNHNNILQERHIICGSWKWLGSSKVESVSLLDDPGRFKKDIHDDFHVVKKLHEILSQADIIVAHYGDNFDIKYFNTRAIYHKLDPINPLVQVDTYKIAKKKFLFNSNRLDYIAKFLGEGRKMHIDHSVWIGALKGNKESIIKMVSYNKQDIRVLENIYKRLYIYVPAAINYNIINNTTNLCSLCGSDKIEKRGFCYTSTRRYQRFKCNACKGWSKSYSCETKVTNEKACRLKP